jgi:glycosyltransferase involved in cell wall biosynthesis
VAAAAGPEHEGGVVTGALASARVAIVHDWLETPGGAELVLEELLGLFPGADLFTMIDQRSPGNRSAALAGVKISTSWLQRMPGVKRSYRSWLPVMPLALRSLDVSAYDIVISNSHAVAKGVRTHARQLHLCYCLSPMRYAWDLKSQYLREAKLDRGVKGLMASAMLERMRRWDLANTTGVTAFATLSKYITERIERAYGRSAAVIYPPVDTDYFTLRTAEGPAEGPRDGAYVTASRFVPYKRIDMIAKAFALLPDRRLIVVGDGPDAAKIRAASGSNVMLVGRESRERVRDRFRSARAFLFAAEEDFGIVPVEAQACGTPVIAFGRGGVTETVRGLSDAAPSGVFYEEQTPEALAVAVRRFEALEPPISADACRASALRFRAGLFREGMCSFVEREWAAFSADTPPQAGPRRT